MKKALVVFALAAQCAWPAVQILAVVNAASFQLSMPTGGALATVFCSGLSGLPSYQPQPGLFVAPPGAPLPYVMDGIAIQVNGALAPILSVYIPASGQTAPAQINFQVPIERNATYDPINTDKGTLQVLFAGSNKGYLALGLAATLTPLPDPGVGGFFADANGYAIAQHASDYSQVTAQNPAHAGETLIVYADDFYNVWPPPAVGFATPLQPLFQYSGTLFDGARDLQPGYLFLQAYPTPNGKGYSYANTPSVKVAFQGLAPGLIGVEQINFVVPANQAPGDWALFFDNGNCQDGTVCGTGGGYASPYAKVPVR